MIDDETEVRDLEAQMHLATEGVRKAVLRLLQDMIRDEPPRLPRGT
jgi:hypothetical protein